MNRTLLIFTGFITALVMLAVFRNDETVRESLAPDAVVLALGDSLTVGYGAAANESYPEQLQRLIGLQVVNAGISGELSVNGLKRLPSLLSKHHPSLVIICHGGNDIMRKKPMEALRSNLSQMIRLSRQSGAEVMLLAVPNFGLMGFSPMELYAEVAEEEGVLIEEDVISDVLDDASLKSDQIHPNAQGYEKMAAAIAERLRSEGLLP